MAFRKRLRRFLVVAPRKYAAAPPLSALDTWLQRTSHIAQFGLFLLTAGTIYFTVIPLYQKALLDEQIAQKEIELSRLQEDLTVAYAKIRSSIVRDFVFQVGVQCSGLMLPIGQLEPLSSTSSTKQKSHLENVLDISPEKCLMHELSASKLDELESKDKAALRDEVSRIGATLDEARQAALAQFANAAETAKTKPHNMPETGLAREVAEHVLENEAPEFQSDVLARIAVDRERSDAVAQYREKMQSEFLSIRNMKWPESESSGLQQFRKRLPVNPRRMTPLPFGFRAAAGESHCPDGCVLLSVLAGSTDVRLHFRNRSC